MPPARERKRSQAQRVRDAILEGPPSKARLIGLTAGIMGAATTAVLIEAFFVLVGFLAPHSTIEGLGSARFVSDGQRLGQFASIAEGAGGGIALIASLWFAFAAFGLAGFPLGQVFYSVGRARASWSLAGVLPPIFGACTAGVAIWAYLSLLAHGSRLANREYWADMTFSDRVWTSDVGILIITLLITVPMSLAILTLWRLWFARIAGFFIPDRQSGPTDRFRGSRKRLLFPTSNIRNACGVPSAIRPSSERSSETGASVADPVLEVDSCSR